MSERTPENRTLTRLAKLCLTFAEATRENHGSHASFRVRKRVFAYFLDNHHGDGKVAVCCKMAPGENQELVRLGPGRFYIPAYIGPQGWVALRLDAGEIDWVEVEELVAASYRLVAPKTLTEPPESRTAARPSGDAVDDRELVARAQKGDRAAFRSLFERYSRRAYSLAFGVVLALFALLSVFAMLAAGCGTSMQTSSEDLNRLTATEGIVAERTSSAGRGGR